MTQGRTSLGSAQRTGPVVADSTLWRRKSHKGVSLLAVALSGGAGGTGVGKGKNWEGAVQDYAHRRTQVATVGNTTMAQVLGGCTSPSLPMSGSSVTKKGRVRPCSDHCAEYLWL